MISDFGTTHENFNVEYLFTGCAWYVTWVSKGRYARAVSHHGSEKNCPHGSVSPVARILPTRPASSQTQ